MLGLSSSLRRRPESRSGDWIPASAGMTNLGCTQTELVSVFSFVLIQLPAGDYVDSYVQRQIDEGFGGNQRRPGNTNQQELALRKHYGLYQPMYVQYVKWAGRVLRGDFGQALEYRLPIWTVIKDRMFLTVVLAGATVLFTWALAIPIGIYSAVRRHSIADYSVTFLGFLGLATPDFLLALILMYFTFAYLHINVGGLFSPENVTAPWTLARVWDLFKHLWIPALILGTSGTAGLMRVMRANLLDELKKPYVVTARAKGLSGFRVVLKHPVRVALNPLVSTVGCLLPYLISGSIIVSVVLSLPTLGPVLLQSLYTQDLFFGLKHNPAVGRHDGSRNALVRYSLGHSRPTHKDFVENGKIRCSTGGTHRR